MPTNFENTIPQARSAPASAAVYQRVRIRTRNLRGVRKFGQEHEDPTSVLPASSGEIRKLEQQQLPPSSPSSRLDAMTDDEVVQEALKARKWLFGILDCHDKLFNREHELRMFRFAVEKELAGGTGESSATEMERMYMALTDYKLTSPEDRLKAAFALVLHLNFAEHLKHIIEQASIRTERIQRRAAMNTARPLICQTIAATADLVLVDHFACAIPLSLLAPANTPSIVDENAGCCPICQEPYTTLSDFPVRIKYCGHIIGKACLEEWMTTPKIDEARHPHRTCPICRVQIENVQQLPPVPPELKNWLMNNLRADQMYRELKYTYGLDLSDTVSVLLRRMSEEIACEELMAKVEGASEKEETFLKEKMAELRREKCAWGFNDEGVYKTIRDSWMKSGITRKH